MRHAMPYGKTVRAIVRGLAVLAALWTAAAWSAPAKTEINLFEGLAAGALADNQHGWTRSAKDAPDAKAPAWGIAFATPEGKPPYLEITQRVWNNGPNLTVTRALTDGGKLHGWQLAGRVKVVSAGENSVFLRVMDAEGHAIASLDRFTLNHTQGKRGPGDSYLTFNGVSVLPPATGKAQWKAIVQFTTEDWKPFRIAYTADKPEVLTLEYGNRTLEAPVPAEAQVDAPHTLQFFFGWGLGYRGKGSLLIESLTFTSERVVATARR